jgi:hypothetical protein
MQDENRSERIQKKNKIVNKKAANDLHPEAKEFIFAVP